MLFAISDAGIIQIVTAVLAFLGTLFTGIMAFKMAQLKTGQDDTKTSQEEAAIKVGIVSDTLKHKNAKVNEHSEDVNDKLDILTEVAHDTHTLVNSNMGIQLLLNQTVTRRLANMTKDPEDIQAADLAEILYKKHQSKQAVVDSRK